MMEIFVGCPASQKALGERIQQRISLCSTAQTKLDFFGEGQILESFETGRGAAALILVLTPDAVPAQFQLSDWEELLEAKEVRLAFVLAEPCRYPKLLERGKFWRGDNPQTLRAISEWVMGMGEMPRFRLAPVDGFVGRQTELEELFGRLVDQVGQVAVVNEWPGSGKTGLAQQFAREAERHFEDIVWLDCAQRRPHLAVDPNRRTLLVLDDVTDELEALPEGRASILATSRKPLPGWPLLRIEAGDYPESGHAEGGRRNLYAAAVHGRQNGVPLDADRTLFRAATGRRIRSVPEALLKHFSPHLLAEAEDSLRWAVESDEAIAGRLVRKVFSTMKAAGRLAEGLRFLEDFRSFEAVSEYCNWELSWVREDGAASGSVAGQQGSLFG
jgi:hypothetical protein